MNKHLQALLARRAAVVQQMQAITQAASASADGTMTDAQRTEFDALDASVTQLDGDIVRVKKQIEAARNAGAVDASGGQTGAVGAQAGAAGGVRFDGRVESFDNAEQDPRRGFRSFGEFAQAVRAASLNGAQAADSRLSIGAAAASSYANEGNGADGGYLVPPEFSQRIFSSSVNQVDSLLAMTDNTPVEGNSMAFPVDETTPWGTGGIKAYWTNEAGASAQSKPQLNPAVLRLSKLTALVPITEELAADSTALGQYVTRKTPEAITWRTNEALWGGDGIAKPKGFFGCAAQVSVAKESGQAAATVVLANITKMRARMLAASYRRAVWMINNDVLPQLDALAYGTTATNTPIYNPIGGTFGYGTLLGRPVMVTQHNETVGTKGDIALVDWMMYMSITKAGGVETATSMHFWFDQGLTAFRAMFRVAGQPAVSAAITPNKGSNSLSPLVVLDTRA